MSLDKECLIKKNVMIKKSEQKPLIKGLIIGFILGGVLGDYFDPMEKIKEMLNLKRKA